MGARLIALTGATGFIGRHLLHSLSRRGYRVRVLLRRPVEVPEGASSAVVGDLTRPMNMAAALAGVDAVVHSAGLAQTMSGTPGDDFRASNTEATLRLAEAAARARVQRFVFLSSIRAQTGISAPGIVTEADSPKPTDAYGHSKLAAERALAGTGLDWVALRPALVYGTGARGNVATLMQWARSGAPLPFGALTARRSLVSVESLGEAVAIALDAPGPLRRPLVVAEPDALTIPDMIAALRAGLGRGPGLLPVPRSLLGLACRLTGRADAFERLSTSLVVRADGLIALGWVPASDARAGLTRFAAHGP
ncbi:NAD-dependent epimerase/dehydratase family protein [Methylobacterium sp. J-068]|uniref:NAD-dependent epimerase/dehydratase family protein n=1 Tax=Methylobacterium sp. J-068 TaxID=2836649 RepID=UPI001FB9C3D2|nr:NAD-dependent epimerase/dehydratase family protein [Methylobacterium sp. J-068]MCJ2035108.1 NAD-dependent epimerase/dehydratase family protein [Methylobacterium sp. J-068]